MFLLEHHRHAELPQFPQGGDAVLSVAGKTGERFDQDAVNLTLAAILHHALELCPFGGAGAGDATVGIDVHQRPVFITGDQVCVISHLRRKGIELIGRITADACVGANPKFGRFADVQRGNDLYLWHNALPPLR
mgnify:CR=1 FL=1